MNRRNFIKAAVAAPIGVAVMGEDAEATEKGFQGIPAWELHLRKIRRAFILHHPPLTYFKLLLISQDLADAMTANRPSLSSNLENCTYEVTPIKIDKTLPDMTAIFVPAEPGVK